jgi:phosphatidylglycerophosphate synthase
MPDVVLLRATRDEAAGAALQVGGLTVVDRSLRQLGRLTGTRVVVASDGSVALPERLPVNIEVRRLESPQRDGGASPGPVQDADDLAARLSALEMELRHPAVLGADVVRVQPQQLTGGVRVVDEATRRAAEDALFADLLRGDLGLVARHINKKISFRITRDYLCHWPFTPNEITLGAGVIGLLGCLLIATGNRLAVIGGFLLAQFQSILDGCDGELARVRFQQTAIGEWLDTVVDDALNLALVAAIGIGLSRRSGSQFDMWIGFAACAMLLTYNVIAYRELIKQGEGGEVLKVRWWFARGQTFKAMTGSSGGTFSFLNTIGKRDFFVFAWLVLAVLDLLPAILLYAFVLALAYGGAAVGQLIVRRPPSASGPSPAA